jgi:Zn finger protein HypA/HybF involved in hydrogenase expression
MQAYCLKCRTKREMQNPQQVTLKNGRPATQGVCPVCGTKMYRIGKG